MWQIIIEIGSYAILYKFENQCLKLLHDNNIAVSIALDSSALCAGCQWLHSGLVSKPYNVERYVGYKIRQHVPQSAPATLRQATLE